METDPEVTWKIEFLGWDIETVTVTEFCTFRKVGERRSI